MKYNINVIRSVWRQLRRPSQARLDAISRQNAVYTEVNGKTGAQPRRNPIAGLVRTVSCRDPEAELVCFA